MAWISGALIADPAAQQVLVSSRFTTPSPHCYVTVVVSSQIPMETFFQLVAADGATVKSQIPIAVTPGLWGSPRLGPMTVDKGETLRVVNRNAAPTTASEEVQANLFLEP